MEYEFSANTIIFGLKNEKAVPYMQNDIVKNLVVVKKTCAGGVGYVIWEDMIYSPKKHSSHVIQLIRHCWLCVEKQNVISLHYPSMWVVPYHRRSLPHPPLLHRSPSYLFLPPLLSSSSLIKLENFPKWPWIKNLQFKDKVWIAFQKLTNPFSMGLFNGRIELDLRN